MNCVYLTIPQNNLCSAVDASASHVLLVYYLISSKIQNNNFLKADHVIVTVSLGVLKEQKTMFNPPLPRKVTNCRATKRIAVYFAAKPVSRGNARPCGLCQSSSFNQKCSTFK